MGSAASSNVNNLSTHQTSEIVRKMKEQYEICQKKDLDLEQQQERLIQSYTEILTNVINTPHYMLPTSLKPSGTPKGSSGTTPTPKKSRRRSFDNNKTSPVKSKLSPQKSSVELHMSESLPVLPASDPPPQGCQHSPFRLPSSSPAVVDTWDSVSAQPSCLICGMVFSTANKLETHAKYSVCDRDFSPHPHSLRQTRLFTNQIFYELKDFTMKNNVVLMNPSKLLKNLCHLFHKKLVNAVASSTLVPNSFGKSRSVLICTFTCISNLTS
jgi:hypothetical protein